MGASPSAQPSGNPGAVAAAMSSVRGAIDILQKALPDLGTGSEQHKSVLNAIQSLSKFVPASAAVPGVQQTTARNLMTDANRNAMMQLVQGLPGGQGAPGAAGGAGGTSPAPPNPAAAAQAMPPSMAA